MKTINLFNNGKTESNTAVETILPQKYCPNCGQKHQVKSETVELEGFPKGIKHIKFFIDCPDEDGHKQFFKYCSPFAKEVVFKDYFIFNLRDAA